MQITLSSQRTYGFGNSRLVVRFGSIVSSDAQVIVSSDDCYVSMGGGVSAAIRAAGGESIALDAAKKVPAALGDIVVTSAGALNAQYVFHAITIGQNPSALSQADIIERATRRCMQLLDGLQLSSIAFPAIGSGVARFSYEAVATTMAKAIVEELEQNPKPIDVTIYLYDVRGHMKEGDFFRCFEELAARVPHIAKDSTPVVPLAEPQTVKYTDLLKETEEEYKRRRIHNLRRLLADLEDQRNRLEQRLIALLGTDSAQELQSIKAFLNENQELRLQYLSELQLLAQEGFPTTNPSPRKSTSTLTAFVSSTYTDLVEHRTAVKDALSRCDIFFRGMEHFGASSNSGGASSLIVQEVRNSDVYIGIFGTRYGSIDAATGLSMTELEFREAETTKKPCLLYVIHPQAMVPAAFTERDPDCLKKLEGLKAYILKNYVVHFFQNVEDLRSQVILDLMKLKGTVP